MEIKANELRIGNWVQHSVYINSYIKVESLNNDGINLYPFVHDTICETYNFNEIEGIQLSEEILLKCGFVKGYPSYCLNGFELLYNNVIGFRFSVEGQYGWDEIKYLHQLQNLYFALTQTELEIRL